MHNARHHANNNTAHLINLDARCCRGLQLLDGGARLADELPDQGLGHSHLFRDRAILVRLCAQALVYRRRAAAVLLLLLACMLHVVVLLVQLLQLLLLLLLLLLLRRDACGGREAQAKEVRVVGVHAERRRQRGHAWVGVRVCVCVCW
jgi:hypothetical protein